MVLHASLSLIVLKGSIPSLEIIKQYASFGFRSGLFLGVGNPILDRLEYLHYCIK
jgi:hypothetical protein